MKPATLESTSDILHKIATIGHDLLTVKLSLLKKFTPSGKNVISLKGIIKGVDITNNHSHATHRK